MPIKDPIERRVRMTIRSIINRCTVKTSRQYKHYGARGITVYPPWLENRKLFATYLRTLDGFDDPELVIDRIENNKGYEPGNLRYITIQESNSNRRSVILLTHDGKTLTLKEWSRRTGINYTTLAQRYHKGWSSGKILANQTYSRWD